MSFQSVYNLKDSMYGPTHPEGGKPTAVGYYASPFNYSPKIMNQFVRG